jgi:hypothetical protein
VIVPVPVYYGGYYYGYPAYGYGGGYPQPDPPAAYGQQYADPYQNQPPAVIYNQDFRPDAVNPQIRDYSNVPLPPPGAQNNPDADQPSYFLIASIDHAIVAVVTYWVDGETLNFITTDGDRKSMPLDQVDREFSKQLNADRRIEFKLPAK